MPTDECDLRRMTADIVVAFLSKNAATAGEVPDFMRSVHATLASFGGPEAGRPDHVAPASIESLKPVVSISESILPDRLICVECGKSLKGLKFHLRSAHALTPEAYRMKWALPLDYPMVAPDHSAARKALAEARDFGQTNKGKRRLSAV